MMPFGPTRARLLACAALLAGLLLTAGAAADDSPAVHEPPRPDDRVYATCWGDVAIHYEGEPKERPSGAFGWRFTRPGGAFSLSWGNDEDLEGGAFAHAAIDTSVTPWRLDLVSSVPGNTGRSVTPGIFRFEGDSLVWMTTGWTSTNWRADGEYPERPANFTPTKANGYRLTRLKPCALGKKVGAASP